MMGGIGMMSAGTMGSPGLGYAKDRFAGEELKKADPALFDKYKVAEPKKWFTFEEVHGLDGGKLGLAKEDLAKLRKEKPLATIEDLPAGDVKKVLQADMAGDRKTLVYDSFIPATMAAIYLLILLYFSSIGGYKAVHIDGTKVEGSEV